MLDRLLPLCCAAVFHRDVLIESSACRKSGRMLCLAVWGFSAAVSHGESHAESSFNRIRQ